MILLGVATLGIALICIIPVSACWFQFSWFVSILLEQSIIAIVVEGIGNVRRIETRMAGVQAESLAVDHDGPDPRYWRWDHRFHICHSSIPGYAAADHSIDLRLYGLFDNHRHHQHCAMLCLYAFLYLLNGILTAYIQSAWTLTFMRLTGKPTVEPLAPVEVLPEVPPSV